MRDRYPVSLTFHKVSKTYVTGLAEFKYSFGKTFTLRYHVMIKSEEMASGTSCTKKCFGDSKCIRVPYSAMSECECPKGFDGDQCKNKITDIMKPTMEILSKEALLKVPTLVDFYYAWTDFQTFVREKLNRIYQKLTSSE